MSKRTLFFKKAKRTLVLCLALITTLSLVACSSKPSPFKQEFESSSYKKLSVYKGYNTKYQDFSNFEKGHGYMSIESENEGSSVLFKGFYQMKCVHISTQDLTEAFKTNTVEEFANLCGYEDYEEMVNNPLFKCTSNELFNHNEYVVCFEELETGGANLYLGKKFEYTFENDGNATSVYNRVMELLSGDDYDEFNYEELKDEDGNLKKSQDFPYALVLGLNGGEGDNVTKQDVLVGETKYTYNFYSEMETFLLSLDREFSNIIEQSKNNKNTQVPSF